MTVPSSTTAEIEQDARLVLGWLRAQYAGGRAPTYPPLSICRGALSLNGQCDPDSWGRLWRVLPVMLERGLIEDSRLPQGDPGVRLTTRGAQGG